VKKLHGQYFSEGSTLNAAVQEYYRKFGKAPDKTAFMNMRSQLSKIVTQPQTATQKPSGTHQKPNVKPQAVTGTQTRDQRNARQNGDYNGYGDAASAYFARTLPKAPKGTPKFGRDVKTGETLNRQLGELGGSFKALTGLAGASAGYGQTVRTSGITGGQNKSNEQARAKLKATLEDRELIRQSAPAGTLVTLGGAVPAIGAVSPGAVPVMEMLFGLDAAKNTYQGIRDNGGLSGYLNADPMGAIMNGPMMLAGLHGGVKAMRGGLSGVPDVAGLDPSLLAPRPQSYRVPVIPDTARVRPPAPPVAPPEYVPSVNIGRVRTERAAPVAGRMQRSPLPVPQMGGRIRTEPGVRVPVVGEDAGVGLRVNVQKPPVEATVASRQYGWAQSRSYKGSDGGKYADYALGGDKKSGSITVELDKKNGYRVRNIFVDPTLQRKGNATAAYDMLNAESIAKTGKPLRSSDIGYEQGRTTMTPEAQAVWDSLVAKGKASKVGSHYEYVTQPVEAPVAAPVAEKPVAVAGGDRTASATISKKVVAASPEAQQAELDRLLDYHGGERLVEGDESRRVVFGVKKGQEIDLNAPERIGYEDANSDLVGGLHTTGDTDYWARQLGNDYEQYAGKKPRIIRIRHKEGDIRVDDPQFSFDPESGGTYRPDTSVFLGAKRKLKYGRDWVFEGEKFTDEVSSHIDPWDLVHKDPEYRALLERAATEPMESPWWDETLRPAEDRLLKKYSNPDLAPPAAEPVKAPVGVEVPVETPNVRTSTPNNEISAPLVDTSMSTPSVEAPKPKPTAKKHVKEAAAPVKAPVKAVVKPVLAPRTPVKEPAKATPEPTQDQIREGLWGNNVTPTNKLAVGDYILGMDGTKAHYPSGMTAWLDKNHLYRVVKVNDKSVRLIDTTTDDVIRLEMNSWVDFGKPSSVRLVKPDIAKHVMKKSGSTEATEPAPTNGKPVLAPKQPVKPRASRKGQSGHVIIGVPDIPGYKDWMPAWDAAKKRWMDPLGREVPENVMKAFRASPMFRGFRPPEQRKDVATKPRLVRTKTPVLRSENGGVAKPPMNATVKPTAPKEVRTDVPTTKPVADGSDRIVRMNNDSNSAVRESLGLDPLEPLQEWQKKHNADAVAKATSEGLKDKAEAYTSEAAENRRSLSPEETAGAVQRLTELSTKAEKAIESGDTATADALQAQFDKLSLDFRATGTVPAQDLQARKLAIKAADYTYATAKQEKAENLGRPLKPEEARKVEAAVRELRELKEQTAKLEEEHAKLVAEMDKAKVDAALAKEAKKASIRSDKSMYVNAVRKERAVALTKFKEVLGSQMNMGVPVDALPHLAKYLLTFAKEGAANVDEVLKLAKADLPDLTRENVIEALTFKREAKPKTQGQKNAALIRQEARSENTLEGLREQIASNNPQGPKTRTSSVIPGSQLEKNQIAIRKVRAELNTMIEEGKPIHADLEGVGQVYDIGNNFLRTAKATADVSATLRQGMILVSRDISRGPSGVAGLSGKLWKSLKATLNGNSFEQIQNAMVQDPRFIAFQRAGGHFSEIGSGGKLGEEMYIRNLGNKIPVVRDIIAGSERHMVSFLNMMRTDAFYKFMDAYPNATQAELKGMADLVNVFSGRGNLGKAGANSKALGRILFAPRFAVSRIEAPFKPLQYKDIPSVRNEAVKSLAATAALGGSIMTLAALAGAEVTTDTKSSDWGKIKVGNTRFDVWAGMQQPTRLLMQAIIYNDFDSVAGAQRFISYKMAPGITTPLELRRQRTITGQKTTRKKTLAQLAVPIAWTDVYEAYQDAGLGRASAVAAASTLGIGASTYDQQKKKSSRRVR
jgi:hypothetical protein